MRSNAKKEILKVSGAAKSSKKENVEKCEFWNFWVLGRSGTGRFEINMVLKRPIHFQHLNLSFLVRHRQKTREDLGRESRKGI